MANAEAIFNSLVEKLSEQPEVKRGNMFGFVSITVSGKTFALLDGDSMVFKLDGDAITEALALQGAQRWNPYGHEKKEWVQIPFEHTASWGMYAEVAMSYVESLIKATP